eukprot:3807968-Rhodomonas_salina.2
MSNESTGSQETTGNFRKLQETVKIVQRGTSLRGLKQRSGTRAEQKTQREVPTERRNMSMQREKQNEVVRGAMSTRTERAAPMGGGRDR